MFGLDMRICYSALLCMSFAVYGYSNYLVNTALSYIQHLTNVSLTTASTYITCQYAGLMTGSVMTGLMFSRVNIYFYHVIILVSLAVTLCAVPWCRTFSTMSTGHFFIGLFDGSLASLCTGAVMRIWGSTTSVPMNSMSFSYSVGSVAAALSLLPFITFESTSTDHINDQYNNMTVLLPINNQATGRYSDTRNTHLVVPYTAASGVSVLLAVCLFAFYLNMYLSSREMEIVDQDFSNEPPSCLVILMLLFAGMIYSLCNCLSMSFHGFLPVYIVEWMKWSEEKAVLAATTFRGSILLGRFLGIFMSMYVSSLTILISSSCLVGLVLVVFILNGLLLRSNNLVFLLCTMYGLFLSPLIACMINIVEQRIIPVRGNIAAYLSVCSCVGSTANSPIIAHFMECFSAMFFIYVLFAEAVLFFIFCMCFLYSFRILNQENTKTIEMQKNDTASNLVEEHGYVRPSKVTKTDSVLKLAKEILFELHKIKGDKRNWNHD